VGGKVDGSPMWSRWLCNQMIASTSLLRMPRLLASLSSMDAISCSPGATVVVVLISDTIWGA
jgi:hypothetical protein